MRFRLIGSGQTRAFRCLWMLEELQIPYEWIPTAPSTKAIFKYNPSGKIPALLVNRDDELDRDEPSFVVTESAVINTFLGDTFPESGLVPAVATPERLKYDQLVMTIMTELDATALWMNRKHTHMGKFFGYVPEMQSISKRTFHKANDVLVRQYLEGTTLGGPYLMGPQFTAADILYGHCINWARGDGFWKNDTNDDNDKEEYTMSETLATYLKNVRERPAFQRAREKVKAEAPPQSMKKEKSNL